MAKNSNSKGKPIKQDRPMTNAMKFFLTGCVAELYLLIVRRFYMNGDALQQIAWFDVYLKVFIGTGVVLLLIGVLGILLKKANPKLRIIGWYVGGFGAFLAISSALILQNMSILTLLYFLVPVVMLLGILWSLYDRECALALSILGFSLITVWVCRRAGSSMYVGTYVKVLAIIYLVLVLAVTLAVKLKKLPKLLPANADPLPVYLACVLSVIAVLISLINTMAAYYAMWVLAIIVFALAVYYTVKQL